MKSARGPDLHILLPGLLDSLGHWRRTHGELARYTAVESLFDRCVLAPSGHYEDVLCELLGVTQANNVDPPLAAIRRAAFGRDLGVGDDEDYCLCADPVHLHADVSRLLLRDGASIDISESDADSLAGLFEQYFCDRDWRLRCHSPHQWHLVLPQAEALRTVPLRRMMGRDIDACLPSGERAMFWRGIMNEVQMLFHDADVNAARVERGLLPVNSLWFYGGGTRPRVDRPAEFTMVWADDALAHGLANLTGCATRPAPSSLRDVLDGSGGRHLLCIDTLQAPSSYDRYPDWWREMERLESALFEPLVSALKRGDVTSVTLYDCTSQRYAVNGWKRLRWPRRAPPLSERVS